MKRVFLEIFLLTLMIISLGFGAKVYIFDIRDLDDYYPDSLYNLLDREGHYIFVDADSNLDEIFSYDIIYCLFPETLFHEEVIQIQDFVGSGGLAIFIGEYSYSHPFSWNRYINGVLEDPGWIDSLGHIHINENNIADSAWEYYPWDTLEFLSGQVFQDFRISSGYFNGVDTIITWGPASVSILSPDSGTAKPFIWGRNQCYSHPWGPYPYHAVLSVIASYGLGKAIIIPEISFWVYNFSSYDTFIYILNLGDNRQFIRNLFATNDRADSVWLTSTDTTFTIHIRGDVIFVAESTYLGYMIIPYLPHYGDSFAYAVDWGILEK